MKILYEDLDGNLIATECCTIAAALNHHSGLWGVAITVTPDEGLCRIADGLTEQEAKTIVRKLFDYGTYIRCP